MTKQTERAIRLQLTQALESLHPEFSIEAYDRFTAEYRDDARRMAAHPTRYDLDGEMSLEEVLATLRAYEAHVRIRTEMRHLFEAAVAARG